MPDQPSSWRSPGRRTRRSLPPRGLPPATSTAPLVFRIRLRCGRDSREWPETDCRKPLSPTKNVSSSNLRPAPGSAPPRHRPEIAVSVRARRRESHVGPRSGNAARPHRVRDRTSWALAPLAASRRRSHTSSIVTLCARAQARGPLRRQRKRHGSEIRQVQRGHRPWWAALSARIWLAAFFSSSSRSCDATASSSARARSPRNRSGFSKKAIMASSGLCPSATGSGI